MLRFYAMPAFLTDGDVGFHYCRGGGGIHYSGVVGAILVHLLLLLLLLLTGDGG